MHLAHPLPSANTFCGRDAELRDLARVVEDGGIACLEGIGGIGKTALLAAFLATLPADTDGFAWSFYAHPDADALLAALTAALQPAPGQSALDVLADRDRYLLILDGFERMQSAAPPHGVETASLRRFLTRFAALGPGRACLCASRLPLPLDAPVRALPMHGLDADDSVTLLRARGLRGAQDALHEVARQYAGHPLTLSLVAGAVGRYLQGDALSHLQVRPGSLGDTPWMGTAEAALTRVLGFYRERLSPHAAALLSRLSLFHGPADEHTLAAIFLTGDPAIGGDLHGLTARQLRAHLDELAALGLVEHVDERQWIAHAVVRDFFPPTLADPRRIHLLTSQFLADQPGGAPSRPLRHDRDILEEAIHHAVRAGAEDFAIDLYLRHMGGAVWLCECGDAARGERIIRTLPPDPRLHADLGLLLDDQGRPEEAARWHWKACRAAIREQRQDDACKILLALSDNAVLRGRLPLAEKLARRAALYAAPLDGEVQADYVAHLRMSGGGVTHREWRARGATDIRPMAAIDVLLRMGFAEAARVLAHDCRRSRRAHPAIITQALLLHEMADFELAPSKGHFPSQAAERILAGRDLPHVVDASRAAGRSAVLADALTFRARLRRYAGDTSGALNDLQEAEDLARRGGLLLHLVRVLLECRCYCDEAPVEEAGAIASRPDVDYGWGRHEAATWLALVDRGVTGRQREVMYAVTMERLRLLSRAGSTPTPDLLNVDDDTAQAVAMSTAGTGVLDTAIPIPGPQGMALLAPVESSFATALDALADLSDEDFTTAYKSLWTSCYESHMCGVEAPGPAYHLAVLLHLEGRATHAAAVAEDLLARHPPFPAAAVLLSSPRWSDVARGDAPALVRHALAHDEGLLHEHHGGFADARRAYERALKADWRSRETRSRLAALDDAEPREKCRRQLQHTMSAARSWQAATGAYPSSLADLGRGLLSRIPTCAGTPYALVPAAARNRLLIACRPHRLYLDSTRGDLTPRPAITPLPPRTATLYTRLRALVPTMPDHARLLVISTRALKLVE